jgi:hypothetical protein
MEKYVVRNWESKHNCISPETDASKVSSFPIFRIPLVPRIKLRNKPTMHYDVQGQKEGGASTSL